MSSSVRESARGTGEGTCRGIVRRMVSLPRAIVGEFSRAMNHSMDLMRIGNRRHQHIPINYPPQYPQEPTIPQDEWAFLTVFEQQYGSMHPFFYACRLTEALKIAEADRKFLFLYLHAPDHPFTPSFCRETLCSEMVVQFLDENFVSWGGLTDSGEGLQMAMALRPQSFPFCTVIAPPPGDSIAVLQQIEGPISPSELVDILQRTVEEQGSAFGGARLKQEEKIKADRHLRKEQDAAYFAALEIDKEKERRKSSGGAGPKFHNLKEVPRKEDYEKLQNSNKQYDKPKEATAASRRLQNKGKASQGIDQQVTQILIRFPNGDRREHSFLCTDKIQSIYTYIDSLGLPGIANYRLVSSFPRKTYGVDQMGMTLKDAGLYPRASLFLEPL
ncbi:plant UBX domain-containing protein 10-like [Syzygium oleosum]|uniref:plant UBX domain-containing protein 10-like n=1 Tax=Syzygium oleosum TaxID=219896 RepID=UPI0024BAAB01|nr:plant UBX domain-containing protein 10-like [Syzygium oleosum]